ncbi:MAG: sigma-54-dependent transcriptional regulator, partial [Planctomycetota bacterium]
MVDIIPLVLTVDDDPHLLAVIEHHVEEWGYAHRGVKSPAEMWQELERVIPSVILLDIALGDADGTVLVPQLKQHLPNVPVIMITAHATVEMAVKSLKSGAYDFICKPLDFDRLHIEIDKAVKHNRLSLQVRAFQSATRRTDFHGMIGRSEPMRKVYRLIETVAPTDAAVLILGETGTGKELAARAIHECSKRCNGPFVVVNAPAIPSELIESALFGHEKGAFTGAHQQHIGFCEQADGGTLVLDEICEMDYEVQAKLLRFLQDHVVQRVGAKSAQAVDVRVIAATNRDPKVQIQNNRLREDFYYRLSVVSIDLAPLRQRPGDIALLVGYFLDLAAAKYAEDMSSISSEAMKLLEAYDWPGNVRQLEHL